MEIVSIEPHLFVIADKDQLLESIAGCGDSVAFKNPAASKKRLPPGDESAWIRSTVRPSERTRRSSSRLLRGRQRGDQDDQAVK